jgi:hypothetical protein
VILQSRLAATGHAVTLVPVARLDDGGALPLVKQGNLFVALNKGDESWLHKSKAER